MTGLLVSAAALLGVVIGSFLNVVVWRVPRGESIVSPPSRCPTCERPIRPVENIPILSWLALRGRCRGCAQRISPRYPAVEAGTALLFGALGLRFGADPALPAYLYLGAICVALTLIDLDVKRLPDAITLPSYAVGIVGLAVAAGVDGDGSRLLRAVLGMAALYAVYFCLAFAYPAGMGFGDVKLSGVLGLYLGWLGWPVWAVGLVAGFLSGGLFGVVLLTTGRAGRKSAIPFGPFMIAGAFLAIFAGGPIAQVWLGV